MAAVYFAGLVFGGTDSPSADVERRALCGMRSPVSIWLKFRGGKGVATSLGAFALLTPKTILCLVAIFILLAVAFRYVSLGSIAVAAAFPLLAWALGEYRQPVELLIMAIVSLLVISKHWQNINRLTSGTESRIGQKLEEDTGSRFRKVPMSRVAVIGGGAWGTALALALGAQRWAYDTPLGQ